MLKKLVLALMLFSSPLAAQSYDYIEKELIEKAIVYQTVKDQMEMFLNANTDYSNSFINNNELATQFKQLYESNLYRNNLQGRKFNQIFRADLNFVLSYRDIVGNEKIRNRFINTIYPGDYVIVLTFQDKYAGIFPRSIVFIYREFPDGWKIVHNFTSI